MLRRSNAFLNLSDLDEDNLHLNEVQECIFYCLIGGERVVVQVADGFPEVFAPELHPATQSS